VAETVEDARNSQAGARNRVEHLVREGGHAAELRSGVRNALWIEACLPKVLRIEKHLCRSQIRGGLIERDRDGRCRDEKDDQQKEDLPSSQDSQVVQEARDDRPVGGGDVSVHGRHRAASSQGSRPEPAGPRPVGTESPVAVMLRSRVGEAWVCGGSSPGLNGRRGTFSGEVATRKPNLHRPRPQLGASTAAGAEGVRKNRGSLSVSFDEASRLSDLQSRRLRRPTRLTAAA
jgi:hypothetical protein